MIHRSGEGDEVIRQKVNLLFEKIQMVRSCAVQNVEEVRDLAVTGRSVRFNTNMNSNICVGFFLAWFAVIN